jgi:hypothetical protein
MTDDERVTQAAERVCAVWFDHQTIYPAFSGEKRRRTDEAMEALREALRTPRAASSEAGRGSGCPVCAGRGFWEAVGHPGSRIPCYRCDSPIVP